jgi:hypothetical protein
MIKKILKRIKAFFEIKPLYLTFEDNIRRYLKEEKQSIDYDKLIELLNMHRERIEKAMSEAGYDLTSILPVFNNSAISIGITIRLDSIESIKKRMSDGLSE